MKNVPNRNDTYFVIQRKNKDGKWCSLDNIYFKRDEANTKIQSLCNSTSNGYRLLQVKVVDDYISRYTKKCIAKIQAQIQKVLGEEEKEESNTKSTV